MDASSPKQNQPPKSFDQKSFIQAVSSVTANLNTISAYVVSTVFYVGVLVIWFALQEDMWIWFGISALVLILLLVVRHSTVKARGSWDDMRSIIISTHKDFELETRELIETYEEEIRRLNAQLRESGRKKEEVGNERDFSKQ